MERKLKTLQDAIRYFGDPDTCIEFLKDRIWPDGVFCPHCGSREVRYLPTRRIWECKGKHPKKQFSIKVGTIFEDSPIGLDKWLMAVWMIANCKNGVSSYEIHRAIGVTQKSAWFMLHRIRLALRVGHFHKLGDGPEGQNEVEIDESFIGGKMKNMHRSRRARFQAEKGAAKTAVIGILDRKRGEIRAKVVPNVERQTLQTEVLHQVKYGSKVYTDDSVAYDRLNWRYVHDVVNHAETYVRGRVHTNGLENFWSLLKRNLAGTYVAVEPFHLDRYLDEQVFRYNNRGSREVPMDDAARFDLALRNVVGKKISYKELTGKEGETASF